MPPIAPFSPPNGEKSDWATKLGAQVGEQGFRLGYRVSAVGAGAAQVLGDQDGTELERRLLQLGPVSPMLWKAIQTTTA